MQIVVASDAHGAHRWMDALLEAMPPGVQAFCFLGDMDKDAQYLDYGLRECWPGAAFYAVAGNNDPFSRMPKLVTVSFDGVLCMLAHGHLYRGIREDRRSLAWHARKLGAPLALYGHTHVQREEIIGDVHLVNPGALMQGEWALVTAEAGSFQVEMQSLKQQ